ncbi:RNA-directed DNA polymerase [Thauera sp.]|uniref:RNA-directed DNA polymerase n=1 Tax=Thauera sp. TaxID=1905334 RepID=UPI0039E30F8B
MTTFATLTSLDNLHACWLHAAAGKRQSVRVQRFAQDALHYLSIIQQRLRDRAYQFGPYQIFTVREKKWRDVVDAPMRDRIVHWMLYRHLLPTWMPRLIHDTYGNLPGRGSHAAVARLADFCRRPAARWALQMDISKYFYSVRHDALLARALRYQGDQDTRRLIERLVRSFRTDGRYDALFPPASPYHATADKGMPIGNLTSQLFANLYLADFDHWSKQERGLRLYLRYVDDLVVLGESPAELQEHAEAITERLARVGLVIHPRKVRLAPTAAGVPFLGYVVWPGHVSAGHYIRSRYHRRLRQHETTGRDYSAALTAYRAMLAHTGSTRRTR